jgi:hypothetical protein
LRMATNIIVRIARVAFPMEGYAQNNPRKEDRTLIGRQTGFGLLQRKK